MTRQPTWRERQRALREEAILEATIELLAQRGYSAMNMDEVANQVGISKATLYQHFPSKEELAVHTIIHRIQRVFGYIGEQNAALPAIERLEHVIGRILEHRYANQPVDSNVAHSMPPHLLRQHPLYEETQQRVEQAIAALVDEAKAQGDISPAYPTSIITQLLLSAVRDANYQMMLRSGKVTPQTLTETLMAIFFNGIRKR